MNNMNSVHIIGTITRELDSKTISASNGELTIANTTIVSNKYKKGAGDYNSEGHFFDVSIFGKEKIHKFLSKGVKVAISGSLEQQRWKDKETGANRSKIIIVAKEIEFLSSIEPTKNSIDSIPF